MNKSFSVLCEMVALALVLTVVFYEINKSQKEITPEQYLEVITQKSNLNLGEKESVRVNLAYLCTEFSPHIISHLYEADIRVTKPFPLKPHISGFEKIGIRSVELTELWSDTYYPKQWIEGNISVVAFNPSTKSITPGYGLHGYNSGETKDFSHKITIFGSPIINAGEASATKENLDWVFSHELGHNNDWINARYLDLAGRTNFLVEISRRFNDPDAYKDFFGYVDSINNPDHQKQNYYRVVEWWGSLCEEYFTFPDMLASKWPKDFALVDRHVRKEDMTYDTFRTSHERAIKLKAIIGQ